MCVCVSSHQPVECIRIMRWCSYNLRQGPFRSLGSVTNFYVLVSLTFPSLYSQFLISFRRGHPPPAPTSPPPMCLCTGSYSRLGVIYLHTSTTMPPVTTIIIDFRAPPSDPPSLPSRLTDSCRGRTLVADKIASTVTLSWSSAAF